MTVEYAGTTGVNPFEPNVSACYGNGWRQLWKHFWELLLILIISWAISVAVSVTIGWIFPNNSLGSFISYVYSILVGGPLMFGAWFAALNAARGTQIEMSNLFEAFKNYWNAVAANFLVSVIIIVGLIFLIIPGIIFACKLAFVPFLVVDRKMDAIAAIKTSWNWTNGYAGEVFLIGLLGIPIVIAGFICLVIGVIPALMWIQVSLASMYYSVSVKKDSAVIQQNPILTEQ